MATVLEALMTDEQRAAWEVERKALEKKQRQREYAREWQRRKRKDEAYRRRERVMQNLRAAEKRTGRVLVCPHCTGEITITVAPARQPKVGE